MSTTPRTKTSPASSGAANTGAEDATTSTHLTEGPATSSLSATSLDIAALMQDMPSPGVPAGERAAWCARKRELLARIEEARRR